MNQIQVYLDTNVYIGAKYIFDRNKLNTLKNLIKNGYVRLIYTNATVGEVKEHIKEDIGNSIKEYNRLINKKLVTLVDDDLYKNQIKLINDIEIINYINKKFDSYLSETDAIRVDLSSINCEELMKDYFDKKLPFENSKPYEFKDAIMIKALKQYQKENKNQICIISSDKGFRKSFEENKNFLLFEYLGEFIKYVNNKIDLLARIEDIINKYIKDGNFESEILSYINYINLDCNIEEWECDSFNVENIKEDLDYIEINNNIVNAHIYVISNIELSTHFLDEEKSYFDEEEKRYIVRNYIHAEEKHQICLEIIMNYKIINDKNNLEIEFIEIDKNNSDFFVEISEDTMVDMQIVNESLYNLDNITYCHQCGKILGTGLVSTYFDYYGNALCSNCITTDMDGEICPSCGRKVPFEFMVSDICKDCFEERE